jgi:hypothetical protein
MRRVTVAQSHHENAINPIASAAQLGIDFQPSPQHTSLQVSDDAF